MNNSIIRWLLKSDPSVVFQTKRDLLDLPNKEWEMDQDQILSSGWDKCLLDLQEYSGRWGVKSTEKDFKYGK